MTELLANYITIFIEKTGYVSVFILMTMESMILPVPSEAVMPFAGFLVTDGKFNVLNVVLWSTLGSILGSGISYAIGYFGGRPFINKFGKYFLLNTHHLDATENFFNKHGGITIFISRFIPIVRHLISIPAGMGKMNIWSFLILTIIGAGMWNTILCYVGITLRSNWVVVMKYSKIIDAIVILAILLLILIFIRSRIRKHSN